MNLDWRNMPGRSLCFTGLTVTGCGVAGRVVKITMQGSDGSTTTFTANSHRQQSLNKYQAHILLLVARALVIQA
jgi:hypothetical protein